MADGILNNSFGLNVHLPKRTLQQIQETAGNAAGGVFEPLFNFISENQNVFTGNVANEIEKYNLMMFNVGAALRKEGDISSFDVKG